MIQINNLKKSFRTEEVETLALNNVTLKVAPGELLIGRVGNVALEATEVVVSKQAAKEVKE